MRISTYAWIEELWEAAITEDKHKGSSRKLLSLPDAWMPLSQTIMTTSKIYTESAHKFYYYFYMPVQPHPLIKI